MVAEVSAKLPTLDDLTMLGSQENIEVINGEVVPMAPVGFLHHLVVINVMKILSASSDRENAGLVIPDGLLFILDPEAEGIKGARVPDVSFIAHEDMPAAWDIEKPFPGPPTLAVEVMSPGDSAEELQQRIGDYLSAGTREVWVAYPRLKELHRHTESGSSPYRAGETLDGSALISGLKVSVDAVFDVPDLGMKNVDQESASSA